MSKEIEKETPVLILTEKQKVVMSELAAAARVNSRSLYGNALDDLFLKLDVIEEREFVLFDRDGLKRCAQREDVSAKFLEDENKEDKVDFELIMSHKHNIILKDLSSRSGRSESYILRVAVDDFLFSLDIVELINDEEEARTPPNPPARTRKRVSISDLKS